MLEDGSMGRAAVPSGASTGAHEAVEMRDGDKSRWLGKGVDQAVAAVNGEIAEAVVGMDAEDQAEIDAVLIALDGTETSRGSAPMRFLASASPPPRPRPTRAGLPLYRYVGGARRALLPVPMMNILNGGAHADNPIDFQEFMVMPVGAPSFAEALRCGVRDLPHAEEGPARGRPSTAVGDEGGFAPNLASAREALDFIMGRSSRPATRRATTWCSRSIAPRPNFSATAPIEWKGRARTLSPDEMADWLADARATPIRSPRSRTAWPRMIWTAGRR